MAPIIAGLLVVWLLPFGALAADPFRDWRDADLVFQESSSPQSTAIQGATGSSLTHLGMIRRAPTGPVVIEAARKVSETPLAAFLARGRKRHFSVYRLPGLSPDDAMRILAAARQYYGRPYDVFFRRDPDEIYCSELPVLAYAAIGIKLGKLERFGDLNTGHRAVQALFQTRWRQHPDCRAAGADAAGCWKLMQDQQIITPVSLSRDPQLVRVYSNFPR